MGSKVTLKFPTDLKVYGSGLLLGQPEASLCVSSFSLLDIY